MERVYLETEHQELFHLGAPLEQPLALHVPSALGALHYYVCLRVDPARIGALDPVHVHARLTGLRSTDAHARNGEGVEGPRTYPASGGKVWFVLCRIPMARGDGEFRFDGVPAGFPPADVLFCTWTRFLASGQANDWLACQEDPQWAPSGVPLGGIGTGRVDICRDGRFRNFSGNNNQDVPFEEPAGLEGAGLSVIAGGTERELRSLASAGAQAVPRLEFEAAFPQAVLKARGAFPGLDVTVTLSGPLQPHDLDNASLPVALVRWDLHNASAEPMTVGCRLAWPNLVGMGGGLGKPEQRTGQGDGLYRFWEAPLGQTATSVRGRGWVGLSYGNRPATVCEAGDGQHYLAANPEAGPVAVQPDPWRGSITQSVVIPAGGRRTVDMALVWAMPHWVDSLGTDRGMYWQNRFAGGESILDHVFASFPVLLEGAAGLQALVRGSDLPEWMWRRLCNCCYPLVTNSVLYRDGRFSINEGPTEMSGVYGTIDQRLGAHAATQFLFPGLNRQELMQFTAVMAANGEVNHDLGGGHLERESVGQRWPDIQCSYAIQMARHAWSTGDRAFAAEAWPRVRLALERHGIWADEGRGVAQLGHRTRLGTSYDSYHYEGTTAYMATLWIAALQVGRRWATQVGDGAFVKRAESWIAAARGRLDEDLWNGAYYRAYAGQDCPSNENCHGGMLAGEWYARLLAGDDVLPPERLRPCAEALVAHQGHMRFAVPPDEVAPDGGEGSLYGWLPYIESFCVAPLAVLRHPQALAVWERMVRCMQGDDKHPCDTRLMYRPKSGEPSWGAYYMTAPASWLVYEALLDFAFDAATGGLRLNPLIEGRFPVVHPLFWGVGRKNGAEVSIEIRRTFTGEAITVRTVAVPHGFTASAGGLPLRETGGAGSAYAGFMLETPVVLAAGGSIAWSMERT